MREKIYRVFVSEYEKHIFNKFHHIVAGSTILFSSSRTHSIIKSTQSTWSRWSREAFYVSKISYFPPISCFVGKGRLNVRANESLLNLKSIPHSNLRYSSHSLSLACKMSRKNIRRWCGDGKRGNSKCNLQILSNSREPSSRHVYFDDERGEYVYLLTRWGEREVRMRR